MHLFCLLLIQSLAFRAVNGKGNVSMSYDAASRSAISAWPPCWTGDPRARIFAWTAMSGLRCHRPLVCASTALIHINPRRPTPISAASELTFAHGRHDVRRTPDQQHRASFQAFGKPAWRRRPSKVRFELALTVKRGTLASMH